MAIPLFLTPLQSISGVAASGTTIIDVPCDGRRILAIGLTQGYSSGTNTIAGACTNITNVDVVRNSAVEMKFTGTQLRDLNIYNGTQFDGAGVPNTAPGVTMPIFFGCPWCDNDADKVAYAWRTGGNAPNGAQSIQVKVTFSTATSPTLVAYCLYDFPPAIKDNQLIRKVYQAAITASGTAFDYVIPDRRDFLQQISLYPDSGGSNTLSKVTMKVGGVTLFEASRAAAIGMSQALENYPLATNRTATIFDITLDADGMLYRAPDLAANAGNAVLTIEAGSAMSGSIPAIIQRVGLPD